MEDGMREANTTSPRPQPGERPNETETLIIDVRVIEAGPRGFKYRVREREVSRLEPGPFFISQANKFVDNSPNPRLNVLCTRPDGVDRHFSSGPLAENLNQVSSAQVVTDKPCR